MTDIIRRESPLILVVDDNVLHRAMARVILEESGFAIEEAADGEQALTVVECVRPDLVLLDLNMPKLDGFAVCAELRGNPVYEKLPVVIVTSYDDDDSINRAFDAGATDFVTKPINWAQFAHHIKYMLRASQMESELSRITELLEQASILPDPATTG